MTFSFSLLPQELYTQMGIFLKPGSQNEDDMKQSCSQLSSDIKCKQEIKVCWKPLRFGGYMIL